MLKIDTEKYVTEIVTRGENFQRNSRTTNFVKKLRTLSKCIPYSSKKIIKFVGNLEYTGWEII